MPPKFELETHFSRCAEKYFVIYTIRLKVLSILFRTFEQKIRGCRRYPLSSEPRNLLGYEASSHCRLRQLDLDGGSRGGYNE